MTNHLKERCLVASFIASTKQTIRTLTLLECASAYAQSCQLSAVLQQLAVQQLLDLPESGLPGVQHSEPSAVDKDNWFSTGDVASIDPLGYMRITDRSKDVIKSGGEWISSIEIENMAVSHEQVRLHMLTGFLSDVVIYAMLDSNKSEWSSQSGLHCDMLPLPHVADSVLVWYD